MVGLVILKIKPRETQRPMDGWMDRPLNLEGHPMPMPMRFATIRKKQKRLPSLNREVNDFVLLSCYLLL